MPERAVKWLLENNGGVTGLIGTNPTRLYGNTAPDKIALPYITYFRINSHHFTALDGPELLANVDIQIDLWDTDYARLKDLAEKVRLTLHGFRGTAGLVDVQAILPRGQRDDAVAPEHKGEPVISLVSMDWTFWVTEAQPLL